MSKHYAASAQAWSPNNPRHLLDDILSKNPSMNVDDAIDKMAERLLQTHRKDYLKEAIAYWTRNNYNSWQEQRVKATLTLLPGYQSAAVVTLLPTKREIQKKEVEALKAAIVEKVKILLRFSDLMPNGKTRGECTPNELLEMDDTQRVILRKIPISDRDKPLETLMGEDDFIKGQTAQA